MFLEYRNWRPPEPVKPTPRLSRRGEQVVMGILGLNLVLLLLGPLAGTSVAQGLWRLVAG